MASITVTLASGTSGKLYATASGLMNTASTAPSTRITISCSVASVTGADVELRKATDGSQITNCPMIAITWKPGGYTQEVLFGSTTAGKPMAQFKYGSTTLSYSSTTVPDGGTITVTAVAASGTVDSTAPSDVGIGGYYYAHNGRGGRYNYSDGTYTYEEYAVADSNQGIRSVPARCGNRVPVDVSFKYNGSAKYFIYMMMRGWSGSSAGCPGDMGMLAGSGPIVNSTFQTGWGDSYKTYRMDVFALSASGIYPSLADMPGDGTSESSCPSNSTWITWPADSSLSMYSVKYYATNGSTILRSNTEAKLDLDFEKVSGSAITFYKGDEIYRYLSGDSGTLVIPSGYRFKGWQKSTDGGSTWSSDITSSSGMGKVSSTDVRLKLVVEPNTIVVTFNKGTGNAPNISNTTVTIGNTYGSGTNGWPTDPTKDQDAQYTYSFKGWYTESSGGTKINSSTTVTRTTNQILYAQYNSTLRSYDITYTGTSGSASVNLPYGTAVTIDNAGGSGESSFTVTGAKTVSNPTRTGYTFAGYTYNSSTYTLTATWTAITYTITYDSSSGSAVDSQTYNIATNVTLRGASTRTGYTFNGWKLETAVNTWAAKTYSASENVGTGKYGNLTLVAQWGATSYIATFAPSGGTWSDSTTGNKTVSYNITQTLAAPATISRNGYTFAGWKVTTAGGNWASGTNYNNSPQTKITGATGQYGAVTFTAQWTANTYTATFIAGTGEWSDSSTGSKTSSFTVEQGLKAPDTISRSGYTFSGWKITSSSGNWVADTVYNVNNTTTSFTGTPGKYGNVTFTSQWTPNQYTIDFIINTEGYPTSSDGDAGNVPSKPASRTVTFDTVWAGDGYTSLPGLSSESGSSDNWDEYFDAWKWDYEFVGWFDAETGGQEKTATSPYTVPGNSTLYAHWQKTQKKYNVRWLNYDNTIIKEYVENDEETGEDNRVLAGTILQTLTPDDPVRPGYTFKGWDSIISTDEIDPGPEVLMSDITFIARYEIVTHKIIFTSSKPTTDTLPEPIDFTIENIPSSINRAASRDKHVFVGWSCQSPEELASNDIRNPYPLHWVDSDIVLYARFKVSISEFEPKIGEKGTDEDPSKDNENYGIPIEDLDDTLRYQLKFNIVGDRKTEPVYDISVGTITGSTSSKWTWDYSSSILTKSELSVLMNNVTLVMDIWRCIVYRDTGTLKVTLETWENDSDIKIGEDSKSNEFKAYFWMIPYVNGEVVDDDSDAVLIEGVEAIAMLDLWANGIDKKFTKRFIGNGKSTVDVILRAHSKDKDGKEVLYGAVPRVFICKLDSTESDETYMPDPFICEFEPSDEDNKTYETDPMTVTRHPFPEIEHKSTNDYIQARLRIKVYDSRHYSN